MGTFNSNILPTTTGLTLGSTVQQWNANLNNLSVGGQISINGVPTRGNGIPAIVAAVDLIGQSTAIVAQTTLYTVPSLGSSFQYRLSWNTKITAAAATSSTLGPLVVSYIDPDGTGQGVFCAAVNGQGAIGTTHTANSDFSFLLGIPIMLNCLPGSNINFVSFGYISNPPNGMQYNLHIRLEAM